jgi:hypothetical protein
LGIWLLGFGDFLVTFHLELFTPNLFPLRYRVGTIRAGQFAIENRQRKLKMDNEILKIANCWNSPGGLGEWK